jgi:hypothetical protein
VVPLGGGREQLVRHELILATGLPITLAPGKV